jgi:hypothetical protein
VSLEHIRALEQKCGALCWRTPAPARLEGVVGRLDRSVNLVVPAAVDDRDHLRHCGVLDRKRSASSVDEQR